MMLALKHMANPLSVGDEKIQSTRLRLLEGKAYGFSAMSVGNGRLKFIFITGMFLISLVTQAQQRQVEYVLPFFGFADNREYTNTVHPPQTIFGARISPEVGFLLDSAHRLRVGLHLTKEFGSEENAYLHNPIIYYQYVKQKVNFYMGFFPRTGLLDQYPLPLLSDTLRYFRPNVEGIYLKLKVARGYQTAWIDWTSRQTDTNRETFLTGTSGRQTIGNFFFDNYFVLYHYAGPAEPIPDDHIRDNAGLMLRLGIDLSEKTFFDSLSLNVSWLGSFDRLRNVYDWQTPSGFQYGFFVQKKNFYCNTFLYTGEGQRIAYGDSFYKAPVYGRADFGYEFIRQKAVQIRFVFSLHYIEEKLDNQQLLTVLISTDNLRKK